MTPAEVVTHLQRRLGPEQCNISTEDQEAIRWALQQVESLTAERDALAGMVLDLRETLTVVELDVPEEFDYIGGLGSDDVRQKPNPRYAALKAALALTLPAAVAQVQEWRESHRTLEVIDKILIEALEAAQAKPAKEAENAK